MNNEFVKSIPMEIALIGALASNIELFEEVQIKSKYDFSDEGTKFLYEQLELFYHKHASLTDKTELTENKFNLFISSTEDNLKKFKELGGWKTLKSCIEKSNVDDFKVYYEEVKKFSLLRQLSAKGFKVQPVIEHKSFANLTAQDVLNIYHHNLNKIYMNTINGTDVVLAGDNLQEQIDSYLGTPRYGIRLADFDKMSDSFLGISKKQVICFGALSNSGKTRVLLYILCHMAFIQNQRVGVMMNETSLEEARLCILTTVCNNPVYGFNIGIEERRLALGDYKEGEYEKVKQAIKYIDDKSNLFLYEITDMKDEGLERAFKKLANVFKCDVVAYDTLKDVSGNWSDLVKTSMLLKSWANVLNIGIIANIQLTDEANNIAVDELNSSHIASARYLKHNLDGLYFFKFLKQHEYSKYSIYDEEFGTYSLDKNKQYVGYTCDKNRRGKRNKLFVSFDLDKQVFKEEGYLIRSNEK